MNKTKVLYVDDERVNLMLFQANLDSKYTIHTALSGQEALNTLINEKAIDIVFTDMKMPKMNGFEFIHEAKKILPAVPYYILTGFDITDEITSAIQDGLIQKYFRKPFDMSEISKEIDKVVTS